MLWKCAVSEKPNKKRTLCKQPFRHSAVKVANTIRCKRATLFPVLISSELNRLHDLYRLALSRTDPGNLQRVGRVLTANKWRRCRRSSEAQLSPARERSRRTLTNSSFVMKEQGLNVTERLPVPHSYCTLIKIQSANSLCTSFLPPPKLKL